jgi:hypothetical protein
MSDVNPATPPSVGSALFGVVVFALFGVFFLALLGDESAEGNPIFGVALACLMFVMAAWRATYIVKAIRARRTRR